MSLLAFQRDFQADLLAAEIEAAPGIQIHRNNYRASLTACLEESFPHTRDWIGGDAFDQAIFRHVKRLPPSSWTLDAYPQDFADTLQLQYPDDPEIAELAALEHALATAFVGPDSPYVSADQLAEVDWDRAALRLVPTLEILRSMTNATVIWSAMAAAKIPPAMEMLPELEAVIVWRHQEISCFRTVDVAEEQAIRHARAGVRFPDLCAAIVASLGEEKGVERAGLWLGRWIAEGLLAGVTMA